VHEPDKHEKQQPIENERKKMAEEKPTKKFHALLSELDDGSISAQLDEELTELMRKTQEVAVSRGQAGEALGSLTLKIAFKVSASGEVEIAADHSIKAPKFPSAVTRRWLDPKTSAILDKNPKQMALNLRDGLPAKTEMRSV
jgi:hypothetical protein